MRASTGKKGRKTIRILGTKRADEKESRRNFKEFSREREESSQEDSYRIWAILKGAQRSLKGKCKARCARTGTCLVQLEKLGRGGVTYPGKGNTHRAAYKMVGIAGNLNGAGGRGGRRRGQKRGDLLLTLSSEKKKGGKRGGFRGTPWRMGGFTGGKERTGSPSR